LRTELYEILSFISDQGFAIYLLTNGILISEKRAKSLASIGLKAFR